MDAIHIGVFAGIGFMILQIALAKIQNPKKRYAALDDRALFHAHSFNKRYAILGLALVLALPLLIGFVFSRLAAIPNNVMNGLIGLGILSILMTASTSFHFWQLSGICQAEIECRKFKRNT